MSWKGYGAGNNDLLSQHIPVGTEDNHWNLQSGELVARPQFELSTSGIWCTSSTHFTTTFGFKYCCLTYVNTGGWEQWLSFKGHTNRIQAYVRTSYSWLRRISQTACQNTSPFRGWASMSFRRANRLPTLMESASSLSSFTTNRPSLFVEAAGLSSVITEWNVMNARPYCTCLLNGCVHTTFTLSHFCSAAGFDNLSVANIRTRFGMLPLRASNGDMNDDATNNT